MVVTWWCILLRLGILWLCFRRVHLATLQYQVDIQPVVNHINIYEDSMERNNTEVLSVESRTEYDFSAFMKMLKQTKKRIPTRPGQVMIV